MSWINEHIVSDSDVLLQEGFVYRIKSLKTGMLYYGIKKFKKRVRRKPLKGKKRVRICYIESDWRTYNTSSPSLQGQLKENPCEYVKEIVKVCSSVTEMKAYEAHYQLLHYVNGTWDQLINEVINLRLRIK
jgi:hypothetical protein